MSVEKEKGKKRRWAGVTEIWSDLLSAQTPKSGVFFALAVKTGVFALLLFTAKHLDQRGWAWNPCLLQVQNEPFDTTPGSLALGDAKSLKSVCSFGVEALCKVNIICVWETSHCCCKSCSQVLQPKAGSPCARQRPDVCLRDTRTGSTCYPCTCHKGLVQMMLSPPWKQRWKGLQRGGILLKLAPSQDQTSYLGAKWLPCCVRRKQERVECAPHLSVEQMAPTVAVDLSQERWGELCPRVLFRPGCSWLSLEYLFHLTCCLA